MALTNVEHYLSLLATVNCYLRSENKNEQEQDIYNIPIHCKIQIISLQDTSVHETFVRRSSLKYLWKMHWRKTMFQWHNTNFSLKKKVNKISQSLSILYQTIFKIALSLKIAIELAQCHKSSISHASGSCKVPKACNSIMRSLTIHSAKMYSLIWSDSNHIRRISKRFEPAVILLRALSTQSRYVKSFPNLEQHSPLIISVKNSTSTSNDTLCFKG